MTDPEFTEALETILHDLRAQHAVLPKVRVDAADETMLYAPDGSGQGLIWLGGPGPDPLANLADQVQEWAVEALWTAGEPAVWPHCPIHPNTHPLTATVEAGTAVWACRTSGATVAAIGELGSTELARGELPNGELPSGMPSMPPHPRP
ncbi:hypothetical protein, partial [Catenulispora pinisilvae]|uniref:hypothetical protein n=1 Tax=Catenulispora pinisilvae TaxID=2705253 RepID=UPI00189183E3